MSRDSTPTTLIGALAISGSPQSSNNDMPVTTRGMRNQRHRNLAASQHASSGTAAGSSRAIAGSSGQRAAARSSGRSVRRPPQRHRSVRTREEEDDDGDDDDDDSDDEVSNENTGQAIREIMSIFADTYPTPNEFSSINARSTRSTAGSEQIQQTRDCRSLAAILSGAVVRDPELFTDLRREFTRRYCAARLVNNLWRRDAAIMQSLHANLENQAHGRDVPDSIADWRRLNGAIENVLDEYWDDLSVEYRQSLASLLIKILNDIFQTDRDLYAGRARTVYAGESSGGNLFRRFISARAEPIAFLEPLRTMDPNLLASQRGILGNLINTYRANGPNGSEAEQYNRVWQALLRIWAHATGEQL